MQVRHRHDSDAHSFITHVACLQPPRGDCLRHQLGHAEDTTPRSGCKCASSNGNENQYVHPDASAVATHWSDNTVKARIDIHTQPNTTHPRHHPVTPHQHTIKATTNTHTHFTTAQMSWSYQQSGHHGTRLPPRKQGGSTPPTPPTSHATTASKEAGHCTLAHIYTSKAITPPVGMQPTRPTVCYKTQANGCTYQHRKATPLRHQRFASLAPPTRGRVHVRVLRSRQQRRHQHQHSQ